MPELRVAGNMRHDELVHVVEGKLYRMLISVSSLSLADTCLVFVMYVLLTVFFFVFILCSIFFVPYSLLHFYFISLPYVANDRVARCDFLLFAVILGIDDGK